MYVKFALSANSVISIPASTRHTYVIIPVFSEISELYLNSYLLVPSLYASFPILS